MSWFIGVDVGGTFTDFFASEISTGNVRYHKRASTPSNPGESVLKGLGEIFEKLEIGNVDIKRLCHGTTVATNCLIQRSGANVSLITTKGFRDLLEIGRQTRPHMYSLQLDHPEPLVPRANRYEANERINSDGKILRKLSESELIKAFDSIESSSTDAFAVCCLFSFLNNDHENRIGQLLRTRFPEKPISLSCQVRPEFREYERCSTTVLNAYLQPIMGKYLSYLQKGLANILPQVPLQIYQSSGGLMSVNTAKNFPIRTALSGPAAGVIGAIQSARDGRQPNIVTLDMGGTSADVALIKGFDAGMSMDRDVAGFPLRLPMVDIHTVGAGGGSIAWLGRDGLMKVGPESAGAKPGPACYGLGGDKPTVTDANLVLGRLSEGGLIGGEMQLNGDAAVAAIQKIANKLKLDLKKTAQGIISIVVANMVRAVRTISVERGHDPRDYALMAFGGAGPLHAAEVAHAMDINQIIIPPAPGILCAQGLIASDLKEEFVQSGRFNLDLKWTGTITKIIKNLHKEARNWFSSEKISVNNQKYKILLDARYVGQNFELQIEFEDNNKRTLYVPKKADEVAGRFHSTHQQFYGFKNEKEPIEIVNVRLVGTAKLRSRKSRKKSGVIKSKIESIGTRKVWFYGPKPLKTPIYDRSKFSKNTKIVGPAIIEQFDSTTIVFPDDQLVVDEALNIIINVNPTEKNGHEKTKK